MFQCYCVHHKSQWTGLGSNPDLRGVRPATNHLTGKSSVIMYCNECRPTWKLYMTSSLWLYSSFWALASLRRCLSFSLSSTHLLHSSLYSVHVLHSRIHRICDVSLQTMPSHLFLCAVTSSLYCLSCESKDISDQFLTRLDVPCSIAWLNEGIMTSLFRNQNYYSVPYMK